jgi:hypothetical protein
MMPNNKPSLISRILNVFYGLYFFLTGILYLLMSLLGFLTVFLVKSTGAGYLILLDLLMSPFLMAVGVLFFMRKKKRYNLGLSILFLIWFITQLYRFFVITHYQLENTDLTNLLFFGIPFVIILVSKYLDKQAPESNVSSPTISIPTVQQNIPAPTPTPPQTPTQTPPPIPASPQDPPTSTGM